MKQKFWKILSIAMFIITISCSIAAFMGHSDAIQTALMCAAATIATFGASKRAK